ncbi:MAG: choice-of-anchor D domain-containing protein [Acidobacteriia bacterium]|nr:choice-of-anchor D domain-containing protein [Terriglobia bacterium]
MMRFNKWLRVCAFGLAGMMIYGCTGVVVADAGVSSSPSSLSFGSVAVGSSSAPSTVVLTNLGKQSVTILQASSGLPQFILSGPALPLTLQGGQNASFQVVFRPDTAGSFSAKLLFSLNRTSGGLITVPLSGTGGTGSTGSAAPTTATYLLSPGATSLSFGNVLLGSSSSQSVALSNTGNSAVTISQITATGSGFTAGGITLPLSLAAGQSASLSVSFAPTATGSAPGGVSIVSNATNSPATISLSGTGVQPQISVPPGSITFGNVTTGTSNTQTVQVSNPGSATLTISKAALTGAGFGLSGLTLPLSLAPAQSSSFTVSFAPSTAGSVTGSLALTSNAPTSPTSISLSGSGVTSTLQLSASPTALSFGNVTVAASATQSVTLSNTGNSSVSVSQLTVTGSSFSAGGLALPLTLAAGQSAAFNVSFSPAASGSFSGSVAVTSNAANSPASVSLSGSGVLSHSVGLSWLASSSSVAGYFVYRGSVSGGPYTRLNASAVALTNYTDSSVQSATTYYYVTTAVDSAGAESVNSNEVAAVIP